MGWNLSRLDGLKFHPGKPGSCNHHLRGHNSKKQLHIFSFNSFSEAAARSLKNIEIHLEAATQIKNISCTFSFRSSRTLISFRSSLTFIKKYEMFPEAATHFLKHKKYQLHKFSRFLHKIYTLWVKIFHNLSMFMKTSLMNGLKISWPCMNAIGQDITLIGIGR